MTALVIVRALNLICGAVALGIPTMLVLAVFPAFVAPAPPAEHMRALLKPLRLWIWAAIIVGLLSGLTWLPLQAAAMSGETVSDAATPAILGAVLRHTQFGNVLLLRLVLGFIMAVALVPCRAERGLAMQRALFAIAALAAAGGFASLAWAGHAVTTPGILHLAADAAHLLAAGVWLGGLVVLGVLFGAAWRRIEPSWVGAVAEATRRFSLIGIACVGTLLATGIVNSWFLVGSIPALVGTEYGHLLLVKLALFTLMVGLAAINRFRLTPRLDQARPNRRIACATAALRALRRNTIAEAVLGGLVLGIVSALGAVPPGLHDQPWWPFSWHFSTEAMALPSVYQEIVIASAMMVTGLMLCILGIVLRRHRVLALLIGLALIACFVPSLRLLAVIAYPTSFYRSPIAYTTESIARGAHLFAENCVQCHGARGKGDGLTAAGLKVRPADLTASHVLDHSEGETFWWLSEGISESGMPGFADCLSEDERWDLVNWVRTLPVGGLEEGLATEVGTGPAPRAPDFSYVSADGKEGSLQDLLTSGPVLLALFTPSTSGARLQRLATAHNMLSEAGLGILAVPLGSARITPADPHFVATADASVALAYRTIAAVPRYDLAMSARHLEFLIDRQGYVRALWLPQETIAWDDVRSLVQLVGQIAKRPLAPYSAAKHVH
jgi:putative copper export protein/mono/diheme cytochrome c family protein/peroxiredoxin